MDDFELQFHSHFAGSNLGYQQIRSAYQFGAQEARDSRLRQSDWAAAEHTLRQDWEAAHPDMHWNDVREAIFTGWQVAHTTTP
jgi:hypothetical protein